MHRPLPRASFAAATVVGVVVVAGTAAVAAATIRTGPAAAPQAVASTSAPAANAGEDPESAPRPPALELVVVGSGGSARLADRAGRTVYVTTLDGSLTSRCVGTCTSTWQPVRSPGGKPQAGAGLQAGQIGSIQRPDGSQQVTLNGRPLYYLANDRVPGDTNGEGAQSHGGRWSSRPDAAVPFPSAGATR